MGAILKSRCYYRSGAHHFSHDSQTRTAQESSRASSSRLCLCPLLPWPMANQSQDSVGPCPYIQHSLRSPLPGPGPSRRTHSFGTLRAGALLNAAQCVSAPAAQHPWSCSRLVVVVGPLSLLHFPTPLVQTLPLSPFSLFSPHFSRHPFAHNSPSTN